MPGMTDDPQAGWSGRKLPRRVARVAHALLARAADNDGGMVTTTEVWEYDSPVDAPTVAHTRRALNRAMRYGLADRAGWTLWLPANRAWSMRAALEAAARTQEAEEELLSGKRTWTASALRAGKAGTGPRRAGSRMGGARQAGPRRDHQAAGLTRERRAVAGRHSRRRTVERHTQHPAAPCHR